MTYTGRHVDNVRNHRRRTRRRLRRKFRHPDRLPVGRVDVLHVLNEVRGADALIPMHRDEIDARLALHERGQPLARDGVAGHRGTADALAFRGDDGPVGERVLHAEVGLLGIIRLVEAQHHVAGNFRLEALERKNHRHERHGTFHRRLRPPIVKPPNLQRVDLRK